MFVYERINIYRSDGLKTWSREVKKATILTSQQARALATHVIRKGPSDTEESSQFYVSIILLEGRT